MIFNKHLWSSQKLDWKTPDEVYRVLNEEFRFTFDPCPSEPTFDGLVIPWKERNFVNPPHGREIMKWVDKAIKEFHKGKLIVLLVASRTDTSWFHKLLEVASEIRFVKGRLTFKGAKGKAPFPSMIIILQPEEKKKELLNCQK